MQSMLSSNPPDFKLLYRHSERRLRLLVGIIAGLNLIMLAGTGVFMVYYRALGRNWDAGSPVKYLLIQFNLATENVTASWYSSMLLLLAAVAAVLCFIIDRNQRQSGNGRVFAFGWLLLGGIFILLSLDETGSLHERVGMLTILNPFGDFALGWVDLFAIPIGLIALFMLVFGWFHVSRERRAFIFMAAGVLLLATVPIQEKIEVALWHAAPDRAEWIRPIWYIILEEGAELFGIQFLLVAALFYLAHAIKQGRTTKACDHRLALLRFRLKIAILSVVGFVFALGLSMWLLEAAMPYLSAGDKGVSQNWFPAALYALAALFSLQLGENDGGLKRIYFSWGLILLVLSAYYGANGQGWLWGDDHALIRYVVNGGLSVTVVILGLLLARQKQTGWRRRGIIIWPLALTLALTAGRAYAGPLDFSAAAILFLILAADLYQAQFNRMAGVFKYERSVVTE